MNKEYEQHIIKELCPTMGTQEIDVGVPVCIKAFAHVGKVKTECIGNAEIIPGADITIVKFAPMGDPVEVRIHGYELSLRLDDAAKIEITETVNKAEDTAKEKRRDKTNVAHPNLGEPGVHHDKKTENPLPDDHVLSFALGTRCCA